jgi:hypothetical protein
MGMVSYSGVRAGKGRLATAEEQKRSVKQRARNERDRVSVRLAPLRRRSSPHPPVLCERRALRARRVLLHGWPRLGWQRRCPARR